MILKKFNTAASPNNALQIFEKDGLCCGACPRIVCRYEGVREGTTNIDEVVIGGTTYAFTAIAPSNTTALAAQLDTILSSLGYNTGGVYLVWNADDDELTILTDYSEIVFNEIGEQALTATVCGKVGVFNPPAECCGAAVIMVVLLDDEDDPEFLQFTITSIQGIVSVTASDGEDAVALTQSGETTWLLDIAGSGLFDEQTITLTVTAGTCAAAEFEFEYTFPADPEA